MIGGVLTYEIKSGGKACGQTLGRIVFVAAEECYMGQAVTVVSPNAKVSGGHLAVRVD